MFCGWRGSLYVPRFIILLFAAQQINYYLNSPSKVHVLGWSFALSSVLSGGWTDAFLWGSVESGVYGVGEGGGWW